ncbi:MAG: hypothetical protein PHC75_05750, partial [Burkholderiales bacterium]|nr:hypothetical protein [Burkholderiales bacterium]
MKPKKLSILLFGLLNGALLSSCNDNSVGSSNQVANKQIKGQQNVKYDNDKVDGVWAAVNGYDGAAINPTINMLSQNNTDSMMTFLGCEDVSGSEKATYNLKSFTDKPISYTKTIPSKFQEFADNYSGGYLIDSLDRQETLQQIKFDGGDYYGDNKKQCYFAISNQDNLKPLYVKLVLDTKKIATYDVTQGFNTWQSKPIEDLSKLSANTKTTMQKLVDPSYSAQAKLLQNVNLTPTYINGLIQEYYAQLSIWEKRYIILRYISFKEIGMQGAVIDTMELNVLLKQLFSAKNNEMLFNEISQQIKNKYVFENTEVSEVGFFKMTEDLYNKVILNIKQEVNGLGELPHLRLLSQESFQRTRYIFSMNVTVSTDSYTDYVYNNISAEMVEKINNYFGGSIKGEADSVLANIAVSQADREILFTLCTIPGASNLGTVNCTPLKDTVSKTNRAAFNKASNFEKTSINGSDIEMRNFTQLSKLEARISENTVKRTGGSSATKAMEEIGITKIAGAMGGPIGFIAEQLILDQVIGLAMHDVSSPKDDIRVTGMHWDVVDSSDVIRWNAKNKNNPIAANAVKTPIVNSSMANAIRVSYAPEAGEVRDNQLNYTLKLDTLSTPFIRPDS